MNLELKALKEHEELQKRLEKLEREAKQLEREAKEKETADLQEEVALRAKIAEKELEMANVSSICGSSFRRISPVGTPDDNLTKVSGWMDKTEEVELQGKAKGSTFATSTTNTASDSSKYQRECALKDGKHPIWKCEKFKKMNVEERGQKAKELKLCFKCLSDANQMRNCSGRLCNVSGCGKPHHRLLHRPYKNVEQKKMLKMSKRSPICHQ